MFNVLSVVEFEAYRYWCLSLAGEKDSFTADEARIESLLREFDVLGDDSEGQFHGLRCCGLVFFCFALRDSVVQTSSTLEPAIFAKGMENF